MREIELGLIRVTEEAAIAASNLIGSGDKFEIDRVATDAMQERFNQLNMLGEVKIGEGEKDKSYGLYYGERLGLKRHCKDYEIDFDIAIDPVDGTRLTAESGNGAIAVIALAGKDCLMPVKEHYMLKMSCGYRLKEHLSLEFSLKQNVKIALSVLDKTPNQFTVCVLDRGRHREIIAELRRLGVNIKLIRDGDVEGALAAASWDAGLSDTGVDLFYGVGGAPEAILAAAGIKCLRGGFWASIWDIPTFSGENPIFALDKALKHGIIGTEELVKGECVFVATGITDGGMVRGVRKSSRGAKTNTLFMRSESGTIRMIETRHGN